jgi:spoIIIJ-associated protein
VESVEAEGRTVNEATEKALEELGLRKDQVEVEVLSEGRPRLLGFRGEPARVRLTAKAVQAPPARPARDVAPRDEDEHDEGEEEEYEGDEEDEGEDEEDEEYDEDEDEDEEEHPVPVAVRPPPRPEREPVPEASAEDVQAAVGVLEDLVRLMGIDAEVTSRPPETPGDGLGMIQAVLDIDGEDLGLLIGRRGQTLASLQYLLNLIVAKQLGKRVAFGVDVDGYRRRREEALVSLAKRTASRVRQTGRSVTLEPMPPNERRIVHITLADDPNVITVSIGEGEARKVAVTPAR